MARSVMDQAFVSVNFSTGTELAQDAIRCRKKGWIQDMLD
jgi:hypothetical protein